jgi:TfoX/Sxy family transcriptional regulator of competence genes
MANSETLITWVRAALAGVPKVKEKKMFGSIAFMVNDKMCISAGHDRLMCRIDPATHDEAILQKGVTTVVMKGREYKGYVHVSGKVVTTAEDLQHWVERCMAYNKVAKKAVKRTAKKK